jgi:hypothetical protein
VTVQTTEQTSRLYDSLSSNETREIVTPYAFHVSPALFGTPLARPVKRGAALCIDIALVGMLSQASSLLLVAVAAFTFFRAGNKLKQKKGYNVGLISLRLLSVVLLFILAVGALDVVHDITDSNKDNNKLPQERVEKAQAKKSHIPIADLNTTQNLALFALTVKYVLKTNAISKDINNGACLQALPCWRTLGQVLAEELAGLGLSEVEAEPIFEQFLQQTSNTLTPHEAAQLETLLLQSFARNKTARAKGLSETSPARGITFAAHDNTKNTRAGETPGQQSQGSDLQDKLSNIMPGPENQVSGKPSLIAWAQGLAADMGLGLGWAAIYFSVFSAKWRGQTPGKRLLGIRVIKLDGSSVNLWESFGRYGGYGAGVATGLLGFMQIYWDPNRQAIQDKIAGTLVIDLRRKKVPFMQSVQLEQ